MIISSIKNAFQQVSMNQRMEKAFKFLQETNLEELPNGLVEIEDRKIFAVVQSYRTKPFYTSVEVEGHKKFIDIQCVVSGHEVIGWMHAENVHVTTPYDEIDDVWTGDILTENINLFRLSANQIAILYPTDAHAPQLADGEPEQVKKIVIKIMV